MPIVWGETLLYANSPSAVCLAYFIDHIAYTQHIDTTLTYPHQGTTRVIVYKNVVYFPLWKSEMKVSKYVDRKDQIEFTTNITKNRGVIKRIVNILMLEIVLPNINCRSHWKRARP